MELVPKSEGPPSLVGANHLAELLEIAELAPPGCFVEVGVYKGGSAWHLLKLAQRQGRTLYCYDTFEGIPHEDVGDSHHIGDFADVDFEAIMHALEGAVVTQGVFPASAAPMPPVAFAHLDCDQYRSVRESAEYLVPRMVKGGVIWFDDSPCIPAAARAVSELFGSSVRLSSDFGKHYAIVGG